MLFSGFGVSGSSIGDGTSVHFGRAANWGTPISGAFLATQLCRSSSRRPYSLATDGEGGSSVMSEKSFSPLRI